VLINESQGKTTEIGKTSVLKTPPTNDPILVEKAMARDELDTAFLSKDPIQQEELIEKYANGLSALSGEERYTSIKNYSTIGM
jgi:hypothetical protein